jgi:hypothetical protein
VRPAAYIAFILAVVTSVQAQAQTSDTALARQLFEQGIEFSDQGEWEQAADRFRRSLELRASPIVAYNLGSALVELQRLVEASEAFRRAIRGQGAPEDLVSAAQDSLSEIEPRIGTLKIEISGPPEGVEIFVDDRRLPSQALGVRAPIDPGERTIRAMRDGEEIANVAVEIGEGGGEEVVLEIPEPIVDDSGETVDQPDPVFTSTTTTATSTDDDDGTSPWLWVGIGGGVLAAAAVAVVLVLVLTSSGGVEDPVPGNLSPAVVEF